MSIQIIKTKRQTLISMWLKREEVKQNCKEDTVEDPLLEPSDCLLTISLSVTCSTKRPTNPYQWETVKHYRFVYNLVEPSIPIVFLSQSLGQEVRNRNHYHSRFIHQINIRSIHKLLRQTKIKVQESLEPPQAQGNVYNGQTISFNYLKALATKVSI